MVLSTDGYEDKTPKTVTAADFDEKAYEKTNLRLRESVQSGEVLYKLITSEDWSLVVPLDTKTATELADSSSVKFRFQSDGTIFYAAFSILHQEDGYYGVLEIDHPDFSYTFNRFTGLFEKMVYRQQQLLTRPMELNIWRAPTDNDRNIKHKWISAHYDQAAARAYTASWERTSGGIQIRSTASLGTNSLQRILNTETVWTILSDGRIQVHMSVHRTLGFPSLPRFGLRLFLPRDMDSVTYCGMGPQESYIDKHRASSHGVYCSTVSDLHENYLRPQENGSHWDCDYVTLKGSRVILTAASETPFSFNISSYTQEELTAKAHSYELEPCQDTVLCLDYRQNGIGSINDCELG